MARARATQLTEGPPFRTKAEFVYESLRARILSGDLRPGERVPINQVARELGVSDIPAREGVKRLEASGLVEFEAHKGAVVTTLGRHEITELFAIRTELEALAIRQAAKEITDAELAELRAILDQMAAAAHAGEIAEYDRLVWEFHRMVYDAQSFTRLRGMLQNLWDSLDWCRRILTEDGAMVSASLAEHEGIYDALAQHDGEAATIWLRAQKQRTVTWFLRRIEERERRDGDVAV